MAPPTRANPVHPQRASITITSTAALSTSTTQVPFRDLLCHSVAAPRRYQTEYRCAEYEYHFVEYEYD